ncbi:MAG: YetF domain-containing protein [Actinomycetota bacterium]
MLNWLTSSDPPVSLVLSAVALLVTAIIVIRIVGLRSLSKMSAFDFVVTVALGSIVASATLASTPLWHGVTALAALLGGQWLVSQLRRRTIAHRYIDNRPVLLMRGSTILEANLTRTRVTTDDLIAKLREANVTDLERVLAVVFESTGDISVLHGDGPLDDRLLQRVLDPSSSSA